MNVHIRYFGQLAEIAEKSEEQFDFPDGTRLEDVFRKMHTHYPAMQAVSVSAAVNNESAEPEVELNDSDQVDLFPPFAGG